METESFPLSEVRGGSPDPSGGPEDPGWVYAWLLDGRVRYIGATWVPPRLRAAKHLSAETDDPRSRPLQRLTAGREEATTVLAFRVPAGLVRAELRDALTRRCAGRSWLATDFVAQPARGDGPPESAPIARAWLEAAEMELERALAGGAM